MQVQAEPKGKKGKKAAKAEALDASKKLAVEAASKEVSTDKHETVVALDSMQPSSSESFDLSTGAEKEVPHPTTMLSFCNNCAMPAKRRSVQPGYVCTDSRPPLSLHPQAAAVADATWWLRDVNIHIEEGQLVCVVGRVGSGKSSLVSALLGEMQCAEGRVALGGPIAYVAQQPWIINDTVQNNITFGLDYDEARWSSVVHVRNSPSK